MKKNPSLFISIFMSLVIMPVSVIAQKGMDESTGIAQQAVKPAVTTLSGKVVEIKTWPYEKTTGKSPSGTHIIVQSGEIIYNIHLGPEKEVDHVVDQLAIGSLVTFDVFRTEKMPENA